MATEDDDFQVLSDKIFNILALFFALCVAVFDFCVVLVSYVCRTSWALAYPPLKTFWDMLVPILNSEQDDIAWLKAVANLITSGTFVILLALGVLIGVWILFLCCLGFRNPGVKSGSYAAKYQSANYGGNTPKGSTFAKFQSQGTKAGKHTGGQW
ncbi:hypothetical protein V8E55_006371 [Tylopilus felleus]